jgi:hypothetical protein
MSVTARERRHARLVGIVLGILIGLLFGVVLPMSANYRDHGSVFISQPGPTDGH